MCLKWKKSDLIRKDLTVSLYVDTDVFLLVLVAKQAKGITRERYEIRQGVEEGTAGHRDKMWNNSSVFFAPRSP